MKYKVVAQEVREKVIDLDWDGDEDDIYEVIDEMAIEFSPIDVKDFFVEIWDETFTNCIYEEGP